MNYLGLGDVLIPGFLFSFCFMFQYYQYYMYRSCPEVCWLGPPSPWMWRSILSWMESSEWMFCSSLVVMRRRKGVVIPYQACSSKRQVDVSSCWQHRHFPSVLNAYTEELCHGCHYWKRRWSRPESVGCVHYRTCTSCCPLPLSRVACPTVPCSVLSDSDIPQSIQIRSL